MSMSMSLGLCLGLSICIGVSTCISICFGSGIRTCAINLYVFAVRVRVRVCLYLYLQTIFNVYSCVDASGVYMYLCIYVPMYLYT
jgi:hypothetical protein